MKCNWENMVLLLLLMLVVVSSGHSQTPERSPTPVAAVVPESAAVQAAAQSEPGPSLSEEKLAPTRLKLFDKPPIIDGALDETVWQEASVLKGFYQIKPGDNVQPSFPTEVLIGYDARNLYLGFRCGDEPGKIRATVAKRDTVVDVDDTVRILLDTFNDKRRAYVFAFNPFGIQQDGIRTEGAGVDYGVDIVMDSKGVLTDAGYTVEVAIPFKSLRYESGKGKLWGVQVFRIIQRLNAEEDSWMPLSRGNTSILAQAGHITGLEGLSTERTLERIPSLTLSEHGKRVRSIPFPILNNNPSLIDQGRFVNQPVALDPGLTFKYSLTPTVILNAAINPDFGQVEADQLTVTANQRFPIFYPERRPFFLEGVEIFQTPLTVLHTRGIVDPDVAVKLSGKVGRNSFGLLLASDNAPGNFVDDERLDPANRPFLDKNAYDAVLRLKRDVGSENNIGFIFTSSNFIQRHNQLTGIDGHFRLNKKQTLDFQLVGTSSRHVFFDPKFDCHDFETDSARNCQAHPGNSFYRTGNGLGYQLAYSYQGRNWGHFFNLTGFTRDYLADLGFTSRTNSNTASYYLSYASDPKAKVKLVSWAVTSYSHVDFDFQRRLQLWDSDIIYYLNFSRKTNLWLAYRRGRERLIEEEFGPVRTAARLGVFFGPNERAATKNQFVAFFSTTPSKKYGFNFRSALRLGTFDYDFGVGLKFSRISPAALTDPNAPLDPGPGRLLDIVAGGFFQPSNSLRLSLDYTKNRLVRDDTHLTAFNDNLVSARAAYQFSRFVAARARVDYSTLSSHVGTQFLLVYNPSPGTAFYAGYNDALNLNGVNPISGKFEPGLQRTERTIFIKMSYLFRHAFGGRN
jgi:hypothetical protein